MSTLFHKRNLNVYFSLESLPLFPFSACKYNVPVHVATTIGFCMRVHSFHVSINSYTFFPPQGNAFWLLHHYCFRRLILDFSSKTFLEWKTVVVEKSFILSGIFNLDFNFEELLPFEKLNKMCYGYISNASIATFFDP